MDRNAFKNLYNEGAEGYMPRAKVERVEDADDKLINLIGRRDRIMRILEGTARGVRYDELRAEAAALTALIA